MNSPASVLFCRELSPRVHQVLQAVALLVWGAVLTYFAVGGRLQAYVHPAFHPFVWAAGWVLNGLGLALLLLPRLEVCGCPDPACPAEQRRSPGRTFLQWVVVVLPLLMTVASSPSEFSERTVLHRGLVDSVQHLPWTGAASGLAQASIFSSSVRSASNFLDPAMAADSYLARTEEGLIRAETIDLMLAAEDATLQPDFAGQAIEIIGQYLPLRGENPPPDQFHLVRIFILCCAADARPIGVTVRGRVPEDWPSMRWMKVKGVARFPEVHGRVVAVVEATSIEPIAAPPQPFLY